MKKKLDIIFSLIVVVCYLSRDVVIQKQLFRYTYKVETGDNITISLTTNDGYELRRTFLLSFLRIKRS